MNYRLPLMFISTTLLTVIWWSYYGPILSCCYHSQAIILTMVWLFATLTLWRSYRHITENIVVQRMWDIVCTFVCTLKFNPSLSFSLACACTHTHSHKHTRKESVFWVLTCLDLLWVLNFCKFEHRRQEIHVLFEYWR